MAKALVTGGAGFIGSHMCEALLDQGYKVTCLDNFSTGSRDNIHHLGQLQVVQANANEQAAWDQLRDQKFDVVVHYAATVGVRRTEEQPELVMADARGLMRLAEFAQAGNAKKIIFASSSEVYGDPEQVPSSELDGHKAWSPYTAVKLFGEYLLQALWQTEKIPTVSLRFFNVYGPRQVGNAYGFVVGRFVEQVLNNQSPTVYGNGQQTRDFVYISDNIQATLAAIDNPKAHGQVMNIGTGQETSVIELADSIIQVAGQSNKIKPTFLPKRPLEIERRCAAVDKMHDVLEIKCSVPLAEGIATILDWQRANEQSTASIPAVQLA